MTVTSKIILPIPVTLACPDRFKLEYDGKILRYEEQFDSIPQDAISTTSTLAQAIAPNIKVEVTENSFKVETAISARGAIMSALTEILVQAQVHGLVRVETVLAVISDLANSQNAIPAYSVPRIVAKEL